MLNRVFRDGRSQCIPQACRQSHRNDSEVKSVAKIFYDEDADIATIQEQTIAVIGYGNQGRAQALNMRDSGLRVIIGNEEDEYAASARADGFPVMSVAKASTKGEALARLQRRVGLFHQLAYHSRTAQYGQEVTARLSEEDEARERARLRAILENIRSGKFARDWTREQQQGETAWRRIHEQNLAHPLIVEERRVMKQLRQKA
jgi:ketol-acid reductoisomerase